MTVPYITRLMISVDVMPWDTATGKVMMSPGCSGWARAEAPLSADISAAIGVVLLVSMVLMLPWVMSFQCHACLSAVRWCYLLTVTTSKEPVCTRVEL